MGVTYQPADQRIQHAAADLRKEYHPHLDEAGVTVCYLMVFAPTEKEGKPKGPALKLRGYPCVAVVRVNSLKLRAQGVMDCTIEIDGDRWPDRPEDEKLAILDHQLEHIQVTPRDKDTVGVILYETDGMSRPVTHLKLHDFHGRFRAIGLELSSLPTTMKEGEP